MANNFVLNLRAVRSEANSKASNMANNTKMPVTRGDMQKQRQAAAKGSFLDAFRGAQQIPLEKASPKYIDRSSPSATKKAEAEREEKAWLSDQGARFLDQNIDKQIAANNATLFGDDFLSRFMSHDLLKNYDKLNKVLDDYDNAPTWSKKKQAVENAYNNFDGMTRPINDWFDYLYYNILMGQSYGDTDPRGISNELRNINEQVRKSLTKPN